MKTGQLFLILLMLFCADLITAREVIPVQQPTSLSFIANAGQITDQHGSLRTDIDYKLNAPGLDIFIGDGQIHYQWTRTNTNNNMSPICLSRRGAGGEVLDSAKKADEPSTIEIYRLDVSLVGANKNAQVIAEEKQDYYERYYLAHTGVDGVTAHSYQKITYQNVYPNIDWVLYVRDNQLKYDFVVHPGGDPKAIKLKYEGADELSLQDGSLTAVTPLGSITEQAPYSYEAETKKPVATQYLLGKDQLQLQTAPYTGTLIIDPVLDWATYYGGTGNSEGFEVAVDAAGFIYMTGSTAGISNIATASTHQTVFAGGQWDGYIVKFNSAGARQWGTYLGGTGEERPYNIRIDGGGSLYVSGYTSSTAGIATPGSHQPVYGGGIEDGFLAKFNNAGQRLWGTYYGGIDGDRCAGLAIDNSGSVYISGETGSTNGISTPGSHQPAFAGGPTGQNWDGFLARFSSAGVRLWGTYYGGSNMDVSRGLVSDGSGNIYMCGYTASTSGIATLGSYQPIVAGQDAFLVKFNNTGNRQWGTYFGGSGNEGDLGYSFFTTMAYDPAGFIYMPGITNSTNSIATSGSYQPTIGGNGDAFMVKFSVSGVVQWATYYGGNLAEYNTHVYMGPTGVLYLCGNTSSNSNIATAGSHQPVYGGGTLDAFVAKLSPAGQRIEASYYGGTDQDVLWGMGFNGTTDIYISGGTFSSTGIATSGSFQPTLMSQGNAFLAKFIEDTAVFVQPPFVDTLLCKGQSLQVPYGTVHTFKPGNVFTVQLSNAAGSFASPIAIGSAVATGPGSINCIIPAGTPQGSGYRIRIVATNPARTSFDNGLDIHISDLPVAGASSNSPVCANNTLNLNATSSIGGVTYSWVGPNSFNSSLQNPAITNVTSAAAGSYTVTVNNNGCTAQASTNVAIINGAPNATAGSNSPVCVGGTLNLTASTTGTNPAYSWNGPNSFTSNLQNPTINGVTAAAAGTYTVVITGSGCSTTLTTNVTIGTPPNAPSAGSNTPVCAGQNINLSSLSTTPGVSYSWSGPGSYTSTQQSPTRTNATVAMSGTYNVVAILNGCSSAATATTVVVNPAPAAPTASNNGPLCAGVALDLFATGQPGATYSWNGPGSYTSNAQNPTILNATTANAGTYNVTQTVAGCTSPAASTTVVINNSVNPAINIFPNPNDSVCPGTPVTFVSVATNGGTTPQYQWYKNGNPIGGATATIYNTSSFNSGDYFSCQLTSNAFCAVPATKMSNNVTLTLIPPAPAQVNITANPGLVLSPWQLVTFTATSVMGGIAPSYQWYRNGQKVIGATSPTWSANNLNNLDAISVVLLSSDPCAVPNTDTSNRLVVNIKTGISKMDHDNNIVLYPNPNKGDFIVKGNINAKEVSIEILNAIGQTVYSSRLPVSSSQLFEHAIHLDVASGVYLLKVTTEAQTETLRFSAQR